MKMQVRHVHTGIHCASLAGLGREIVDVGDSENVTWESTNRGSHASTIESEAIHAIHVYCMQRERYDLTLRSHLRRLR